MARIFDVIEYPNEMRDEIVHRFPETGIGDYRIGSQVIVREAQAAVFFRDGNALDVFRAGRHTISTANIPLLINLIGKAFNDRTPFPAEVYFVSMKEFANEKWGTPQPIIVRNPGMGLGVALLQGFGTYAFQVKDPQQFVTQIVGTQGAYRTTDIEERLRTMLLSILQDVLGETTAAKSVVDLIGLTEEMGAAVRAKAQDDFEALGLTLKSFYIGNLKPSSKSAQELRDMGMLDMATYTQLQAADAMRDAAQQSERWRGSHGGHWRRHGHRQFDAASHLWRDATATAAKQRWRKFRRHSGSDDACRSGQHPESLGRRCRAAIADGSLKAKKLGNAYRISKDSLEEFLKS